ncbi:MAG: peptidoglycan DD-metalloendopeptidase family protein [Marinobacter sp.]|uniref:OapA family protein n=1 Tax=Marinobacter sp. TaxID=50741 RepID=UPI00299DDA31|nr:peptidoglycan DD-metalloendopeptidase family protein [Marinobacter sp.]MDX1757605.1 peptidoglycan DD-metalloendopeptidase family protein [Marinobacter sp.]
MLNKFPRTHLAAAIVMGAVVSTAMILSPAADVEAGRMSVTLDLETGQSTPQRTPLNEADAVDAPRHATAQSTPSQTTSPTEPTVAVDVPAEPEFEWSEFEIRSGDTLSALFKKAGFNDGLMLSVIHGDGDAKELQRLYAGEHISFASDDNGELAAIKLQRSRLESLSIERTEAGFVGERVVLEPEARISYAEAEIESSLFGAGQAAGLTDKLTMELAGIFGWDIDFVLDIRKGDSFSVVYEELYLDGEKIDNGRILAASFNNSGRELTAVLYTDNDGVSAYYTPEGRSMRKAFLRTPVDFARISSHFNLSRRHPVLHRIRAHKGTDYAASTGTPIKAAGDGKVIHAGRKGGFGNAVVLQHGNNITTLYAHMRGFARGIRTGRRVTQGQVIGYVGSSGLATGPHLHYEFRVNGAPRNPVTVPLPDAEPIASNEMARFKAVTQGALAQLETYQNTSRMTLARGE